MIFAKFLNNFIYSFILAILITMFFFINYKNITKDTSLRTYLTLDCKIQGGYTHLEDSYLISYFSSPGFVKANNFYLKGFENILDKKTTNVVAQLTEAEFGSSFLMIDKPFRYFQSNCFDNNDILNVLRTSLKVALYKRAAEIEASDRLLSFSYGRRDILEYSLDIKDSKVIVYSTYLNKNLLEKELMNILPSINFRISKQYKMMFNNQFSNLINAVNISSIFLKMINDEKTEFDTSDMPVDYMSLIDQDKISDNKKFLEDFSIIANDLYDDKSSNWVINLNNLKVKEQNLDFFLKKSLFLFFVFFISLTSLFFLISLISKYIKYKKI